MADKTKMHEVVDFINRKEGPVPPECKSHDKTQCEVYYNDYHEPACVMCVTTTHKKHDISDIKSIVENLKRRIAADVEDMENIIRPKYTQYAGIGNSSEEFDKVMNAIQDQEENICKVVREIGSQLKDEVAKQKREFEQKTKEVQSSVAKEEKELDTVIQSSKGILKSNNVMCILTYLSKNEQFKRGPQHMQISIPMFLSGNINRNQLQEMFGPLTRSSDLTQDGQLSMQKLMSNPVVLSTIQTPHGSGLILKTLSIYSNAFAFSLSLEKKLSFSVEWPDTKVYRYDDDERKAVVHLRTWCPRGLCHSANGDLLVSMRSVDKTQSRVVRYSGTTETMVIQNDRQGKPLFSVNSTAVLLLTENGNGDICVADNAGKAVVVVNASGELRFNYQEKKCQKPNYKSFKPLTIATDDNKQIIFTDSSNNVVHVTDSDGNFLRYIEYPCSGGLSIDHDHNLVIGDLSNGKIRIIKY
uniref:Uncharacterized protein LOC111113544 n=1 Tax=Crassostrea virginica TaxID=6565 RepID=A0A8B8BW02_CRAVI|nr:uncharacterized protein LOC111113544 [Crassostrea virginica]